MIPKMVGIVLKEVVAAGIHNSYHCDDDGGRRDKLSIAYKAAWIRSLSSKHQNRSWVVRTPS